MTHESGDRLLLTL